MRLLVGYFWSFLPRQKQDALENARAEWQDSGIDKADAQFWIRHAKEILWPRSLLQFSVRDEAELSDYARARLHMPVALQATWFFALSHGTRHVLNSLASQDLFFQLCDAKLRICREARRVTSSSMCRAP
jgi:hypothetical protein